MKQLSVSFLFGMLSVLVSCGDKEVFDEEKARKEIYVIHNAQRKYHFEKDSVSFVNQLSADYIEINKGKITTPGLKEKLGRYHNYFSRVEFLKWDDLQEPVIRFSEDGSLAYTIVDKIVEVSYKDENGEKSIRQTHFAWTLIYRKMQEGWKVECAISTNEPILNDE